MTPQPCVREDLKTNNSNITMDDLKELCNSAIAAGQKLDLKGCAYDSANLNDSHTDPADYYCFLAGLVRLENLNAILEIGTYMGGSIMAMSRGLNDEDAKTCSLVTVDIESRNQSGFKDYPHIQRIQGNALNSKSARKISQCFKKDLDILFIDSDHTYLHVKRCIAIYANLLKPKYLILDDIHYNNSMERLWRELKDEFKNRAIDLTQTLGRKNCGFGLVYWGNVRRNNWRYCGLSLSSVEFLRETLSGILPGSLKKCLKQTFGRKNS